MDTSEQEIIIQEPAIQAEPTSFQPCPVNSYNEWDPLEEVVVGRLDNVCIPDSHIVVTGNVPGITAKIMSLVSGLRYPRILTEPAQEELEQFIELLESEGVTVRRPEAVKHTARYRTPQWKTHGFANACPRDSILVVGNEIIETPMAWRCRYFETHSYRPLLKEYFRAGARWTAAPHPQLTDELYNYDYKIPEDNESLSYVVNEFEPVFDAADFMRCGRDLFVIRSNVTNEMGIDWLRRHLGDEYRIHMIEQRCRQPMHIDTTFMPLAPGKLLINPEYLDESKLPEMFRSWDILKAPEPDPIEGKLLNLVSMCGKWLSMNVLSLDEKRVIVDKHHKGMIKALKSWGFEPITCSFLHYAPFGGSFHCATLDVRRRGKLESYF